MGKRYHKSQRTMSTHARGRLPRSSSRARKAQTTAIALVVPYQLSSRVEKGHAARKSSFDACCSSRPRADLPGAPNFASSFELRAWITGRYNSITFGCCQSLFPEYFSTNDLVRRLALVHVPSREHRAAPRARQVAVREILDDAPFEALHQRTLAAFCVTIERRCALLTENIDAGSR